MSKVFPHAVAFAAQTGSLLPVKAVMIDLDGTLLDTLPDIARRFNLGYEEIVRANPGVDPWLPGEGRVIYLPTEFVLPDAPREGVVIKPRKEVLHPHIGRLALKYPGENYLLRKE